MDKHPNSRTVTIHRLPDFITRAQGGQIQDFLAQSSEAIGAYFEKNSPAIGSGLTRPEIDLLLPELLQIDKQDRTYNKEVSKFFNSMNTKVPFTGGITLEIGLTEDNNKPLSDTNRPIDTMEYIRYRHAKNHPEVSETREAGYGNQTKKYYIFDPTLADQKQLETSSLIDQALLKYLEIKDEESKLDIVLIMFSEDPRKYKRLVDKQTKVREFADKQPKTFMDHLNTTGVEDLAWIKQMIRVGLVKDIAGKLYVTSSSEYLGASEKEAVMTLNSPDFKEISLILKGGVQEAQKKELAKSRGKK